MGFMKFSKDKAEKADMSFGLIEEGDYEVMVSKAEYRPVSKKNKTANFNLTLTIRNDVEQAFKGRKLFHTFWLSEKTEEAAEACMNMIQAFLNKLGATDGMEFDTPQEVAAFMEGNVVQAHVIVDEYEGKERNEVKYFNVAEIEMGEQMVDKDVPPPSDDDDPFAEKSDGSIDISDDDLPF